MSEQATKNGRSGTGTRAKRLTADARRKSILQAARAAFSETGDMNGTTIRVIAEKGGISEGVIYRHFESKDQLFFEAVVEPLQEAIDELLEVSERFEREFPLTAERQLQGIQDLYRHLIAMLVEVMPLLGLVLFGDPAVAERFHQEKFAAAMDRLADAWRTVAERHGLEFEEPQLSSRAVMGLALMLALESRFTPGFDVERAVAQATDGTWSGFFPADDRDRS